MSLLGNYPLTVFVANHFNPNSEITIIVNHYHHLTYYDQENNSYTIKNPGSSPQSYSIQGGCRLGFPMYFGDELLEITLTGTPPSPYYIRCGAKSGCLGEDDLTDTSKAEFIPTEFGDKEDVDGSVIYHRGGTWKLLKPSTNWKLKIQKYGFDPEEENVTIGEDED
jgi:hypothetical protein